MKITILAALLAAALPVAAQTSTPRAQQGAQSSQLTAKECKKLMKAQDKQGKKIQKEKHDKQTAAQKS
jgi:hypothetical protein